MVPLEKNLIASISVIITVKVFIVVISFLEDGLVYRRGFREQAGLMGVVVVGGLGC